MTLSGLLAIYKPPGISSKDVSRKLTRVIGKYKMGHVGTLDPIAEGVLPILLGKATRLQDYLLSSKKSYDCDIFLGKSTDTLDVEGEMTEEASFSHVTSELVREKMSSLLGEQIQIPPIYSAVKYKGKALYKYARAGEAEEVPLEELKREVVIHSLEMIALKDGVLRFSAEVSKGTYIRVLAHDLAKLLGTLGHVTRLIRTKSSDIDVKETVELKTLLDSLAQDKGALAQFFLPLEKINIALEKVTIFSSEHKKRIFQGQRLSLQAGKDFSARECFLSALINSCETKEVLLKNKDSSLFAIAEFSKNSKGFSLKIKKGLV